MHGVKAAAVHALEQHEMPAGIDDRDAHREARFVRAGERRRHDLLRAGRGEPLRVRNVHRAPPRGIY